MMKNEGTAVAVRELRVVRGGREVIPALSWDVPAGQVVGLLGPSGCGKTTLLRSVVGVQRIAGGSVTVLGRPAGDAVLRRRVGYVTQSPSVYSDLTVIENLNYFAAVQGLRRRERGADVDRVLHLVDLSARAAATVGKLSGGQRSRVSLAAALLGTPELLVLDEPTVGLDPVLRRDLWGLFGELARGGTTLLVSSHVMDEAARCDRLLLMREGAVLADDTLDAVLAATGQPDVESAFLALVDRATRSADQAGGADGPSVGPAGRGQVMSPRLTVATAGRVLRQVRHDPRTVALLVVVPCVLLGLLAWVYDGTPVFDHVGAALLGVFPFVVMFLITSVATLRERQSGTLERLLSMPLGKGDLIGGYALAFGLLGVLQALAASAFSIWVLGLDVAGSRALLVLVATVDALLGTALGLLVSAFAATEFQAVQFLPAFVLPQFLLCGLLVDRDTMPGLLHAVSDVLPLSYAVDAMQSVTTTAGAPGDALADVGIVLAFVAGAVALGAATLRRRTA